VLRDVVDSWGDVKRPAVVTFVIDTSGSMEQGGRLDKAKTGLYDALDIISDTNQVGLVGFSTGVHTRISPGPKAAVKSRIAGAVDSFDASGNTSLYDAIAAGIEMSDGAPAADDAIRAVVVLSDGRATCDGARLALDDLVGMSTVSEAPIASFGGSDCDATPIASTGPVTPQKVVGVRLKLPTAHPVQIFFVGVGEADLDVGRIVAGATGAEYQGTPEADLAAVLGAVSDYF
jgi:hypothetical protein